ncbi:OmpP1/FadL family transporter [Ascidiimonas aurantiaca]|uniref:OmpP1/FadL family transporter n=1 Tax=Ascidiimonas aurantiaca TaxID=1685432 RepID=UPI0030ED2D67
MKRMICTLAVLMTAATISAQSIGDVVRYGTENIRGTARFQGMSGAFGALGGDMSAININPAGSAVFANSFLTITGSNYDVNNQTRYFNGFSETSFNNIELNQLGGVFVFEDTNPGATGWKKFSLAFNYDLVNNFDNEFLASGQSNQSIDEYFLNFANGVPFGAILIQPDEFIEDAYLNIGSSLGFTPQQAFLGYFGGIIDPVDFDDDDNTVYVSNADFETVNQDFLQVTTGHNARFTANFAGQYNDNFYLGASLNFHDIEYERLTRFDESGYNQDSPLQFVNFDNLLRTFGNAFSFNVGGIARLNENVRVGASYQSPTWYRLTDELSQSINSNLADSEIEFINFSLVNVFPDYRIFIPSKLTGSLALVFGQQGLISFDYSYQNMANAELRPASDIDFATVNNAIGDQLRAVSSYRIGGEYKIERVSLRAGYRFEQSPYEDGNALGDLTGFSAGLGYSFGATRLDLAYSRSEQEINQRLFDTGLPQPANIESVLSNIILSLSFNL